MPRFDKDDVLAAMQSHYADFYGQYALLKPSGSELRGPCPIHSGMAPSFAIDYETGLWHCHSKCGAGGDVFRFLEMLDGIAFTEAVERVATFAGVSEQSSRPAAPRPAPTPAAAPSVRYLDITEAEAAHQTLMQNDKMRLWLSECRDLTNETLTRFQIGLLRPKTPHNPQDIWRVTFPVFDRQGRLTNIRKHLFAYRPELTDEKRRELGKTKPWEPGLRADLYPLSALDGAKEVVIVEGEADAVLANQLGIAAITGTGGAGTWHDRWTDDLAGLSRVTVLYDADETGQSGAQKAAASISRVVPDVRIATLPAALLASKLGGHS